MLELIILFPRFSLEWGKFILQGKSSAFTLRIWPCCNIFCTREPIGKRQLVQCVGSLRSGGACYFKSSTIQCLKFDSLLSIAYNFATLKRNMCKKVQRSQPTAVFELTETSRSNRWCCYKSTWQRRKGCSVITILKISFTGSANLVQ